MKTTSKEKVCPKCNGRGEHVNPHFIWSEVRCETCNGEGVVEVVEEDSEQS